MSMSIEAPLLTKVLGPIPPIKEFLTRRKSSLSISTSIDEIDPFPNAERSLVALDTSATSFTSSQEADSLSTYTTTTSTKLSNGEQDAEMDASLRCPFVFQHMKPYSHVSIRNFLSFPAGPNEWCTAVLQQRWFQSIGNKLMISAAEFHFYAIHGLNHLHENNRACDNWYISQNSIHPYDCECILNCDRFLLHKWAGDIIEELRAEIEVRLPKLPWNENGTWGPFDHLGDGTWRYPGGILPEMMGHIPLPYLLRRKYYDAICEKWKDVPANLGPIFEFTQSGISGNVVETEDWLKKKILRQCFVEQQLQEFSSLCWSIGNDIRLHLLEEYSDEKWTQIEQEWREEMENEQKGEECAAVERERVMLDTESQTSDRCEEEAIMMEEEEIEERDREQRNNDEEIPRAVGVVPQLECDASLSDESDLLSSPTSTPNMSRSSSQCFSAEEIKELLTPSSFNWADESEEEEPFTLPLPAILSNPADKDECPSLPSEHSLCEDSNHPPADVEAAKFWTRSGRNIFDSESEEKITANASFAREARIPAAVTKFDDKSPGNKSGYDQSRTPWEGLKIPNADLGVASDLIEPGQDVDVERPEDGNSAAASFVEDAVMPIASTSDVQLPIQSLPLALSQGEQTSQVEGPTEDQDKDLLVNLDEPLPSSLPIHGLLQDPPTLPAEVATHIPLPDSEDQDCKLQQEEKEVTSLSIDIGMRQLLALTFLPKTIFQSCGTYSLATLLGGNRHLPHQPAAPIQENWRMQTMTRSQQPEAQAQPDSQPQGSNASGSRVWSTAVGFVVTSVAIHFSISFMEAVSGLLWDM